MTVWVSATSHRSRARLRALVTDPGPEFGVWPASGGWARGSYYKIPSEHAEAAGRIKGLRVLRKAPAGRIFERWTS